MLDKLLSILASIAFNGFVAIFVTALFYILFAFVFVLAMIPVSIILGDEIANKIMHLASSNLVFKILYACVFISMVMDDLGIPSIKTLHRRWQTRRTVM